MVATDFEKRFARARENYFDEVLKRGTNDPIKRLIKVIKEKESSNNLSTKSITRIIQESYNELGKNGDAKSKAVVQAAGKLTGRSKFDSYQEEDFKKDIAKALKDYDFINVILENVPNSGKDVLKVTGSTFSGPDAITTEDNLKLLNAYAKVITTVCGADPFQIKSELPEKDPHSYLVENCLKLTKGFKPTIDINAEDRYGNTALLGFCKAIAEMPQRGEGRAFYKWATQIIDSMLSKGANPGIVSRHGLSPLDMAGYWDLAPEAKKLRLNGGTLYDLIWSQLALFTRKRDKENASTPTATVKKINGLIVKANVLSAESNRHINKLTPETLKSKAVEVSSAQRMDRKAMFGRDNVRYQDSSNSLDKH